MINLPINKLSWPIGPHVNSLERKEPEPKPLNQSSDEKPKFKYQMLIVPDVKDA